MKSDLIRCSWANTDNELMRNYHDNEWGRPCHDDQKLFELLSLEIMQAGLSWQTVLNKRSAFKDAFVDFDYLKVQSLEPQLPQLLANAQIIRNKRKILAIIANAKVIASMASQGTTFNHYLWSFVNQTPIQHHYRSHEEIPSTTEVAKQISKQMKLAGFKFTGPVVIYSFMQAAGLVNDHETGCFLYQKIAHDAG
ncbi:DNA-3-methyladenine glycosylase I [Lentilactobacillus fungorum]|uniref:DNA-3-methyladenine glycosylase I n=1 Tax=Lentilactobacillus fungorum TaxID=2201250 RepID=A0ABQ3VZS4_9LACO|nr:DNA-3-methyladenine glycosylase I [Lentilactobacillus fungorum]GHP14085.1 DNA-3-methyladenine glycosylase I [Lentilactobacillus fungorum]